MRKLAAGPAGLLVMGILAGGLVLAGETRAQTYPPPVGSLSVEASSATTSTGGTSNITATVLDESGNPVEGAEVTFRIVSQPGDDAAWSDGGLETTGLTDASGIATAVLRAGSAPGSIIIETISGAKTSQVTVTVEAATSGLPPTGSSPRSESNSGVPAWQIALMAAGAAALAGGVVIIARRNKRA